MKSELYKYLPDVITGNARLSDEAALALYDSPLQVVGQSAHKMRLRMNNPYEATYLVDRNINYTNICDIRCDFCAFSRDADDADAYVLSFDELDAKLDETVESGGSGVLLQGGCNTDFGLDSICAMLSHIKSYKPELRVHALSPPEIAFIANKEGISVGETLGCLIEAGLDSLPGGGAEILVDAIRKQVSPKKCSADEWFDIMREAHSLGLKTTATMMFGHIETWADRIEHLSRLRKLQDETGGFTAFIPWTFQPANTRLADEVRPAGGVDYLKTLAISRLYLDNIPHIGASWLTQGLKIASVALQFGADDVGSVMLEENVVAAAGCGNRTNKAELTRVIIEAGFKPRRRDAVYNYVDTT